jgi:hypothetical protein
MQKAWRTIHLDWKRTPLGEGRGERLLVVYLTISLGNVESTYFFGSEIVSQHKNKAINSREKSFVKMDMQSKYARFLAS